MTEEIEKAIVKYLTNSATVTDLEMLSNWIENPNNNNVFKDYIQTYYAIICSMNNTDSKKTVEQLLRDIRKEKSFVHQLKTNVVYKYAAAASVILMLALTVFLNKGSEPQFIEPIIVNNQIKTGTDKATLTLENGEEVTLKKGASFQTPHAISNGEEIIYNSNSSQQLVYNHLTISRGEEFQLTLSDGTQVWLNSESQLKYPVSFTDGDSRQVELVYGEAYFDVSPSTEHNGAGFKVYHRDQEVQVLGTEFNIKAYKDEVNIYTTLVEGKVAINTINQNMILAPSEQSNLNKLTKELSISAVEVYDEISWKEGIFIFKRKTLKEIMKVMSRWYDMDVVFENQQLEDVRFIGTLGRTQNITDILNNIRSFGVIKNYEIKNKTITLK